MCLEHFQFIFAYNLIKRFNFLETRLVLVTTFLYFPPCFPLSHLLFRPPIFLIFLLLFPIPFHFAPPRSWQLVVADKLHVCVLTRKCEIPEFWSGSWGVWKGDLWSHPRRCRRRRRSSAKCQWLWLWLANNAQAALRGFSFRFFA